MIKTMQEIAQHWEKSTVLFRRGFKFEEVLMEHDVLGLEKWQTVSPPAYNLRSTNYHRNSTKQPTRNEVNYQVYSPHRSHPHPWSSPKSQPVISQNRFRF
jgi:hypothetical protein